MSIRYLFAAWAIVAGTMAQATTTAELIIVNAHVWTVDDALPEAEAVAIAGERILSVGSNDAIKALAAPGARVIDAGGRLVLPGLQDNHTHFVNSGEEIGQLDLKDAATPEEFGRRIAEYAKTKKPGQWITGGNWDHDKFPNAELPTAKLIDKYCADIPVFVNRFDGHMAVGNSLALKLGNVTAETTDPLGGTVVREPGTSTPAGVLKDTAMSFVGRAIPNSSHEQLVEATRKSFAEARKFGLTTIQDMIGGRANLAALEAVRAEGGMTARIYGRWPLGDWQWLVDRVKKQGYGDDLFTIRSLKGFVDGSIGSSTAWMFEPYSDDPTNYGLPAVDMVKFRDNCMAADAAGLQLSIHAIGDRAIYEILDIVERCQRTNGMRDRRPRVEHDQHTHPRDIRRHTELGVIACLQPYHAIDDGRFVIGRVGHRRCMTSYAFRSFLDAGARMCFGSDWSVAPLNPMVGIDAAVNRQTLDGKNPNGWYPEQKITVQEAIRAYTIENAYAAYMEAKTGSITPGKYADIVILDKDLLRIAPEEIKSTQVDMTMLGGKVVFER